MSKGRIMNSSQLTKRVEILRATETISPAGQTISTFNSYLFRFAKINPLTTRELLQAQQIHSEITTEVYLRYPLDLKPRDQIKYNNRIFEILGIINMDEANHFLRVLCKERV